MPISHEAKRVRGSECTCESCKDCRKSAREESIPMDMPEDSSVLVVPVAESVPKVPLVATNTDPVWWPPDWKAHLSERMNQMAENIYPRPNIAGSYKSIKDTSTLMIRETEHGVGVFVDLTPAADLNVNYSSSSRRGTLRVSRVHSRAPGG